MLSRRMVGVTPRRRALTAALVAGLTAVAVVAALGIATSGRPPTTPVRPVSVAQDRPGPVLLVPGYGGSTAGLTTLMHRLQRAGRNVTIVRLPGTGTGDLRDAARALDAAARPALATGAPSVDVVGYSAGGVTARYWVAHLGGDREARRIVTLGSPHHGTQLAAAGAAFLGVACPLACQQLVPRNPLLADLNAHDETPDGPQWLSLWSAQDEVVTPADSARLEGAVDVVLQDICPGVAINHGQLPTAPLVRGLVLRALGAGPIPRPDKSDCVALQREGR